MPVPYSLAGEGGWLMSPEMHTANTALLIEVRRLRCRVVELETELEASCRVREVL